MLKPNPVRIVLLKLYMDVCILKVIHHLQKMKFISVKIMMQPHSQIQLYRFILQIFLFYTNLIMFSQVF